MIQSDYLLHPELFGAIPVLGGHAAAMLDRRVAEEADVQHSTEGLGVTVAIRSLNEADHLAALLEDVHSQHFAGEVEILVVDNDSADLTAQVARWGDARVVNLPRDEFTYPRTTNLAMEAASFDSVFLTIGHALLSNTRTLEAGVARMQADPNVTGIFAHALPGPNVSSVERLISMGNIMYLGGERNVKKAKIGDLASTGAMISKRAWQELGRFDDHYESGGDDTDMAKRMIAAGFRVVEDPILSVHHTHNLSLKNTAKQWVEWFRTTRGPRPLDKEALAKRRPDLNFE